MSPYLLIMDHLVNDKLRIKSGDHSGLRATIVSVGDSELVVREDQGSSDLNVSMDEVQNYSLAARKAWQSMPERRVGRPPGTKRTDRMAVNLRIDCELWKRFQQAEADGVIGDRGAFVNRAIRNALDELLPLGGKS